MLNALVDYALRPIFPDGTPMMQPNLVSMILIIRLFCAFCVYHPEVIVLLPFPFSNISCPPSTPQGKPLSSEAKRIFYNAIRSPHIHNQ